MLYCLYLYCLKLLYFSFQFHRTHLPRILTLSDTQYRRKEILDEFCKDEKKPLSLARARVDLRNIIVNSNTGSLFCSLPKVASTNWKLTFLSIDDKYKGKNLSAISGSAIHDMMRGPNLNDRRMRTKTVLSDFYKFMFVRHPFERLASCYRNKFVMLDPTNRERPHYMTVYGSKILKLYRKGLSPREASKGFGVTFAEFARWLIEKRVHEEHWSPIFDICRPCLINYDFIGHMSTLRADAIETLHHIGLTDATYFQENMSTGAQYGYNVSSMHLAKQLFSKLDKGTVDALYKMYEKDFLAFGFTKDL